MAVCGGGKRLGEGDVGIDPIRQDWLPQNSSGPTPLAQTAAKTAKTATNDDVVESSGSVSLMGVMEWPMIEPPGRQLPNRRFGAEPLGQGAEHSSGLRHGATQT